MVREGSASVVWDLRERSAYRNGWEDGRFGLQGSSSFSAETGVRQLTDLDRRAYDQGHQEGQRVRQMLK